MEAVQVSEIRKSDRPFAAIGQIAEAAALPCFQVYVPKAPENVNSVQQNGRFPRCKKTTGSHPPRKSRELSTGRQRLSLRGAI